MTTLILFLWLIPIAINVYIDRHGKKPNYGIVFTIRGIAAILHGVLFDVVVGWFPPNLHLYSVHELFLMWLPLLLFQVTSYWIIFELAINRVTGKEWLYFDRHEKDSGWIDKIFDALGNGAHLAAKIMALIVCIVAIATLYE
jgi:hypothetical protein